MNIPVRLSFDFCLTVLISPSTKVSVADSSFAFPVSHGYLLPIS